MRHVCVSHVKKQQEVVQVRLVDSGEGRSPENLWTSLQA